MSTLEDLRKQRQHLDDEIAQREKEEADAWDGRLDELTVNIVAYADARELSYEEQERKNLTTITISGPTDNPVDVELGYTDHTASGWGTYFGVTNGKMRISFDSGLPTGTALVGLIDGILFPERWRK